jgi:hypothetical protein
MDRARRHELRELNERAWDGEKGEDIQTFILESLVAVG